MSHPISESLFGQPLLAPHRRWPSLIASALLHIVVLSVLPGVSQFLDQAAEERRWRKKLASQPWEVIHIPERLYLAASGPKKREREPAPAARPRLVEPRTEQAQARPPKPAPRLFEPPAEKPRERAQPAIPEPRLDIAGRVQAPQLEPPKLPKPAARPFEAPRQARAPQSPVVPEPHVQVEARVQAPQFQDPKLPRPAARRFELPKLARQVEAEQTVLQPQFPHDLPLERQVQLPQVMFWTQTPRLPKPANRPFVTPGHQERAVEMPRLDAPPQLQAPNREMAVSDLKMGGAIFDKQPALPRPPSTVVPIRTFRPPPPGSSGRRYSVDPLPGDAVNLVAVSSSPAPLSETLKVPAGNQLAKLKESMPGPPAPSRPGIRVSGGAAGGAGAGEAGASGGTEAVLLAKNTGSGERRGAPGGPGGAGQVQVLGGQLGGVGADGSGSDTAVVAAGRGHGGDGGNQLVALPNPPPPKALLAARVAGRVIHPENGVFDAVIIQTSVADAFEESTGILSGRPIYSVYLKIGETRPWILQYCVPADRVVGLAPDEHVVDSGTSSPIRAPYPFFLVRPAVSLQPGANYLLVHGQVEITGRFSHLKALRGAKDQATGRRVLETLQKWEFRPAARDGKPLVVEVLLAIPAD